MKRLFDLVLASVLLCAIAPLAFVVAVMVKLNSPGPSIYRQRRVGLKGEVFEIYKFRTMRVDADTIGDYKTRPNDERITSVGKFLRKSSLDEIPQLINVIKGDMSLVGPRPDTPMQEVRYTPEQWIKRISVLPGITGLAQATFRSDANHEQRLRLDFEYIDTWSVWLDLKILIKTLGKLSGKGAN